MDELETNPEADRVGLSHYLPVKVFGYRGFRQVVFGLMEAAITFGIGKLIGVSLSG